MVVSRTTTIGLSGQCRIPVLRFEQPLCHFLSQFCIIKHDGHYRMRSFYDIKTCIFHLTTEVFGIAFQLISQFG